MATPIISKVKVERRDEGSTDWNGRTIIRLDCRDQHGRDLHIYVAKGHQLEGLGAGDTIKIIGRDV